MYSRSLALTSLLVDHVRLSSTTLPGSQSTWCDISWPADRGMLLHCSNKRKRQVMQQAAGPSSQDNEWGFGRVVRFLLWAPLDIQTFYYTIGTFLRPASKRVLWLTLQ